MAVVYRELRMVYFFLFLIPLYHFEAIGNEINEMKYYNEISKSY